MKTEGTETRETGRLEAFSDGVFAIAVTLLILEVRVPLPETLHEGQTLWDAIVHEWPAFLAFATSFVSVLIMWINHHNLFKQIDRSDHTFLLLNGLLLFVITFVPYPTHLVATYLREPYAYTAAAIYAGTSIALGIAYNLLWNYATRDGRLLAPNADMTFVQTTTRLYRIAPIFYVIVFVLAFINPVVSFVCMLCLALLFALPTTLLRPRGARTTN